MKYVAYLWLSCALLGLPACKKDSGIEGPTPLEDFSGLYFLKGNLKIRSNPPQEIPFQWEVLAADQGNGYRAGSGAGYNSSGYRWTIGEIYSWTPSQFRLIVHGGDFLGTSGSDAHWTLAELDSIFQPGKLLSFGTNFGQVGMEFSAPGHLPGEYWTLWADNTTQHVKVEEVNDLASYLPERKWVKQVVVTFNARLNHVFGTANASPDVELTNCRASLLFSPNVD